MARMNGEMREIIKNQPYAVIATLSPNGLPYLIVAEDKWIIDDELLVFGRWQMYQTEQNLRKNPLTIVLGVDAAKRRSIRFFGRGKFVKRKDLKLNKKADRFDEFLVVKIHRIQFGQWGSDSNTDFVFDHHYAVDHEKESE